MIYFIGLWANVLPGFLLLLLVWKVAERYEPGYGAATAVILGLGTLVFPLSTLLFSHVFTAFLGFAAFTLMLQRARRAREPDAAGARRPGDGLRGHLGVPAVLRRARAGPFPALAQGRADAAGRAHARGRLHRRGLVGIIPLLLYNHYAFGSWTHLAYSDVPSQQKGFFGIGAPSLKVLSTLLLDSRGLLTISPVLIMGAIGTVMLYRRGRRAEALTIGGICLCYVGYNSGYYLPFGGGLHGTPLPDHDAAVPGVPASVSRSSASPARRSRSRRSRSRRRSSPRSRTRWSAMRPRPSSGRATSEQGFFQPTIASAFGLGRGWGAIWPFAARGRAAGSCSLWPRPRGCACPARRSGRASCASSAGRCSPRSHRRSWASTTRGCSASCTRATKPALHKGFGTLPAEGARSDRGGRRPARPGGDGAAARRATTAAPQGPGSVFRHAGGGRQPEPSCALSSRCISQREARGRRRDSRPAAVRGRWSGRRRSGCSRCRRSSRRCRARLICGCERARANMYLTTLRRACQTGAVAVREFRRRTARSRPSRSARPGRRARGRFRAVRQLSRRLTSE